MHKSDNWQNCGLEPFQSFLSSNFFPSRSLSLWNFYRGHFYRHWLLTRTLCRIIWILNRFTVGFCRNKNIGWWLQTTKKRFRARFTFRRYEFSVFAFYNNLMYGGTRIARNTRRGGPTIAFACFSPFVIYDSEKKPKKSPPSCLDTILSFKNRAEELYYIRI